MSQNIGVHHAITFDISLHWLGIYKNIKNPSVLA